MNFKQRSIAAALHLLASLVVASLAAILVFFVWFPFPYREVSGGKELFLLIMGVDIVVGPVLTFVVFNRTKPRKELWRDLSIIGALQVVALCFGLWTVFSARPIYLVHEVDRFRVVTIADIDTTELPKALPKFQKIPLFGIPVIGTRKPRDGTEMMQALDLAIGGRDISARPEWWQDLDSVNKDEMRRASRSFEFLRARAKDGGTELNRIAKDAGLASSDVIGLPLASRRTDWSVLMNRGDLKIIGYVPIDSF